jgi:hypothetical protein
LYGPIAAACGDQRLDLAGPGYTSTDAQNEFAAGVIALEIGDRNAWVRALQERWDEMR